MDWQPITTAPKVHANGILAFEPMRGDICHVTWLAKEHVMYGEEEGFVTGWYICDGEKAPIWYRYQHLFTHWMPLPDPPLPDQS